MFTTLFAFIILSPLCLMVWSFDLSSYQYKKISLIGVGLCFFFSIILFLIYLYDSTESSYLHFIFMPYIQENSVFPNMISFYFDSLNLNLLILTNFIFYLCIYYNNNTVTYHNKYFTNLLLFLLVILNLLFCVFNLFWFYVLFEISLLPMFFIIGIWGSRERRVYAALLFVMYASIFSLFFLFGLFNLFYWLGTYDWFVIKTSVLTYALNFNVVKFQIFWFCLLITFLAKLPIFPLHIWLPEAHAEAPTVGSVILASILLKVGGYAILRFLVPFVHCAEFQFIGLFNSLFYFTIVQVCLWISFLYSSLIAVAQVDFKKVVAYSSIVHMSLCAIGMFSQSTYGVYGAQLMLFSHAFTSAGLFFIAGMLYSRFGTRLIKYYSGVSLVSPQLSFFTFAFMLANIGFPGSFNFISELLIFIGIVNKSNFLFIFIFGICFVISLLYTIWIYNKMFLGTFNIEIFVYYYDLKTYERNILWSLLIPVILFGFIPNFIFLS